MRRCMHTHGATNLVDLTILNLEEEKLGYLFMPVAFAGSYGGCACSRSNPARMRENEAFWGVAFADARRVRLIVKQNPPRSERA